MCIRDRHGIVSDVAQFCEKLIEACSCYKLLTFSVGQQDITTYRQNQKMREDIDDLCNSERVQFILHAEKNICKLFGKEQDQANILGRFKEILHLEERSRLVTIKTNEDSNNCPICFGQYENKIALLGCKHEFCRRCIVGFLDEAMGDASKLPVKCITCSTPISLLDLRQILQESKFLRFLRLAKRKFLQSKTDIYAPCYATDCEGVIQLSTNRFVKSKFCISCGRTFCLRCKQEAHNGLTCEQNLDKIDPGRSLRMYMADNPGVRECPKCSIPIEKLDGCNHVECSSCHVHICWWQNCMKTFSNLNECMIHMRKVHQHFGNDDD
eukprot:TRINITY_DN10526_c0_g1_i1.p1 TRINITY_DN10526_c0_g1~~TRINITY_DN10526_c0_g1_i1.p1  ORF type:complete len:325 (+),score=25.84 TRINITY_DN10526_c0_g1_i1:63-1037(+)